MKKVFKNRLMLLITLGIPCFTMQTTQGMAKLRAFAQPLVRGFQALNQPIVAQSFKPTFFKNQLYQPLNFGKETKNFKNNNFAQCTFSSNGHGYKNAYSESSGFDPSLVTKNFFGPLFFTIVNLNQANNERLNIHIAKVKQLLKNEQFVEANEYCKSIRFGTEAFALKILESISNAEALNIFFKYDGSGHQLLNLLSQKNKDIFIERILNKNEILNNQKWSPWSYQTYLLYNLSNNKKEEIILPILQEAFKARTLETFDWDRGKGYILFNALSQEKQQKTALFILQETQKQNTLKNLGWNNGKYGKGYSFGYVLLNALSPQTKEDISLSVLQEASKTGTLKDLGWDFGECGNTLLNEFSEEKKEAIISSLLHEALKQNRLKDLGWKYNDGILNNINECGYMLLNSLSQNKQEKIALSVLQKALETNTLKDLEWRNCRTAGNTLFNSLSQDKKEKFVLSVLQKALETNTLKDLGWGSYDAYGYLLFKQALPAEKQQEIALPIIQKALETNTLKDLGWGPYGAYGYWLFKALPKEKQQEIALLTFQKALETNTLKDLGWGSCNFGTELFQALPAEKQQEIAFPIIQKAVETDSLQNFEWGYDDFGTKLFKSLSQEKQQEIALSIFQKALETNALKDLGWKYDGYGYTLFNVLSKEKQQELALSIFQKALKTNILKDLGWKYGNFGTKLFDMLSQEKQQEIALSILQKTLKTNTMIIHSIDEMRMIIYFIKHIQNSKIKTACIEHINKIMKCSLEPLFQVPYYETYMPFINGIVVEKFYSHPNTLETLYSVANFTKQETEKGHIVLCHGQADQWAFLQNVYREIISIKTQKNISDNFVALRFNNYTNLDQAHVDTLRTNGVQKYDKDRFNILFTTVIPFQNDNGSNSYLYVTENSDQSMGSRYTSSVITIFKENGMQEEFEYIQKYHATLFDELEQLYKDANQEQGNYGNLICFSLPAKLADKLTYPTRSGGGVSPVTINNTQETRISKIIEHFDQVGDSLEIALILAPEILDPEKARAAGVKMHHFGPMITQETEKYMNFKAKLDEVMAIAKKHYDARMNHTSIAH